jgi:two-component system, cell cycle response regulator DivK
MAMIRKAAGKNDMSKRILVVDDQPDNRQIIRDMLALTDYEITEAENGELALAAIAKQRPDLILMDIQLPIMDGYTATSRIKSDPKLRSIPIIAVTSYALSGEDRKARAAGCDDCVPKSFSPRHARSSSNANSTGRLRREPDGSRYAVCDLAAVYWDHLGRYSSAAPIRECARRY